MQPPYPSYRGMSKPLFLNREEVQQGMRLIADMSHFCVLPGTCFDMYLVGHVASFFFNCMYDAVHRF